MIITTTLNPAMDNVLVLDEFHLNATNRIQRQFRCVGGKGTHVSINLSLLGIRSIALGIVRGPVGQEIIGSLNYTNIDLNLIYLPEGNSRINHILLDNKKNCTILSEKGEPINDTVIRELIDQFSNFVNEGDIVVISGDASNQQGTNLQDDLINIAKKKNGRLCLDTSGDQLSSGVRKGPFLIKPNLDELSSLCGKKLESQAEILDAIKELITFGIKHIVVSCGSRGSIVYSQGQYFEIIAPNVPVRNTIGCGDALLSGLIAGFEHGLDIETNLRQATAIAAATAMNEMTVGFNVDLLAQLSSNVVVKPLYT